MESAGLGGLAELGRGQNPLGEGISDGVPGLFQHVEESELAAPGPVFRKGEQPVHSGIAAIVLALGLVQAPYGQFDLWIELEAGVEVMAPVVFFIGIIRQIVVLEAVDPAVVVEIHPEEEIRSI